MELSKYWKLGFWCYCLFTANLPAHHWLKIINDLHQTQWSGHSFLNLFIVFQSDTDKLSLLNFSLHLPLMAPSSDTSFPSVAAPARSHLTTSSFPLLNTQSKRHPWVHVFSWHYSCSFTALNTYMSFRVHLTQPTSPVTSWHLYFAVSAAAELSISLMKCVPHFLFSGLQMWYTNNILYLNKWQCQLHGLHILSYAQVCCVFDVPQPMFWPSQGFYLENWSQVQIFPDF